MRSLWRKETLIGKIMIDFEIHGQEINRLHRLAYQSAEDTVTHVIAAGLLLVEVKKEMKHGKFLRWVQGNAKVSVRQAQRYMAVAQGKKISLNRLIDKNDITSHLKSEKQHSDGVWVNDQWEPEPGFMYLFKDATGTYWVTPSSDRSESFHVCKHYSGEKKSTKGFFWRYTIFSPVSDPDLISEFYIGTRFPLWGRNGVAGVLQSYGLFDLQSAFQFGSKFDGGSERPFGEPPAENWYWDSDAPVSQPELFRELVRRGYQNANGAITFLG